MAPGAALAGAVERLVAPLLAPSPSPVIGSGTAGASGSTDGVIDACSAGAGLFADAVDPGERALVEAAESLVVNDDRSAYALADLGADGLSELVAACGRLAAWAQWAQSVAAVCLARCPGDVRPAVGGLLGVMTGAESGIETAGSPREAGMRVRYRPATWRRGGGMLLVRSRVVWASRVREPRVWWIGVRGCWMSDSRDVGLASGGAAG